MSDRHAELPLQDYELIPARAVDDIRLLAFAQSVLHGDNPERLMDAWWRRAECSCATAAMHRPSGDIAGLCVARPSQWAIGQERHSAVAICGWYVSPAHTGQRIGQHLVNQFQTSRQLVYAFSISDDAIRAFERLGWVGPYRSSLMVLPVPRLARIAHRLLRRNDNLTLDEYDVETPSLPESLGEALERVDNYMARSTYAHMRRGRDEWEWRMGVCGPRRYWFCVASQDGVTVGYIAARRVTPGSSRILGKREATIITDLVAPHNNPALSRALVARAVSFAGGNGAVVALAATTVPNYRTAYASLGFLSPDFPILGRRLARSAPQFMWLPRAPGADLTAVTMSLSLSDSDVDLNL